MAIAMFRTAASSSDGPEFSSLLLSDVYYFMRFFW